MIGRREILAGLSIASGTSWLIPSAQAETIAVAPTKRGFVDRPGCRIYYEVTGSGPAILFAHGLGSNHMTWWQQVAGLSGRYTCVTFSHRGYPPSSEIGVPDPKEYPDDLAALIEHLRLPDLRLVAQSMGGQTVLEYLFTRPNHQVRALVLASTSGSIVKPSVPLPDPQRLAEWNRMAAAARADMTRRGIAPPAGERMARDQPELHMLYREIANASSVFDREELRKRLAVLQTRQANELRRLALPTQMIVGDEDTTYPPFLSDGMAALMPDARVVHVPDAGHSVYFQRAELFNRLLDEFFTKVG
jgi:pimeloyl-ACP methyl ester carboxylesterase